MSENMRTRVLLNEQITFGSFKIGNDTNELAIVGAGYSIQYLTEAEINELTTSYIELDNYKGEIVYSEQAHKQFPRLKNAVSWGMEKLEDLYGSIHVLRSYMGSDDFESFHAERAIDSVFNSLIQIQVDLEEAQAQAEEQA